MYAYHHTLLYLLLYAVDAAYEASDKHTYLPMTINGGTLILVLVVFAVLYKQLAPRTYSVNELESVNASTVEKTTVIKSSGKPL